MATQEQAMQDVGTPPANLLDLPPDLLSRAFAASGMRGITCAAASCRSLLAVRDQLARHQVFASGGSAAPDMDDAIRAATARAMEGMLGTVDFAVVLIAGYDWGLQTAAFKSRSVKTSSKASVPAEAKGKKPGAPGTSRPKNKDMSPADLLHSCLPEGVPVVGCNVSGIMAPAPDGGVMVIDPAKVAGRQGEGSNGVAVLLGRMPGHHVRPFVDLGSAKSTHAASCKKWLLPWPGAPPLPEGHELCPQAVWMFSDGLEHHNLIAPDEGEPVQKHLVSWLEQTWKGEVVVSGGVARTSLIFSPGPRLAELCPDWSATKLHLARFAGLAICSSQPISSQGQEAGPSSQPISGQGQQAGPSSRPDPLPVPPPHQIRGVRAGAATLVGVYGEDGVVWRGLEAFLDKEAGEESLLLILSGGTPVDPKALQDEGVTSIQDLEDRPYCAVWRDDCMPGADHLPFSLALMQSGGVVVLTGEEQGDWMDCWGGPQDLPLVKHILALGPSHVRAQRLKISGQGCARDMRLLMQALRGACEDPTPKALQWDGYGLLYNNALACGARSSRQAIGVFSCNGRGADVFGPAVPLGSSEAVPLCSSEACILDRLMDRGRPSLADTWGESWGQGCITGAGASTSHPMH